LIRAPAGATTTLVYLASKVPSKTATATDSSGEGGFFNVKPGPAAITGSVGGKPFGTVKVLARAGFLSQSNLVPTP
jgi:hypothetical protein